MKKLFNCSARYDENNLVSYFTQVVKIKNGITFVYCYRSNTTLSHIRKFTQATGNTLVKHLYDMCIKTKYLCATYNAHTGEIILDNDYEQAVKRLRELGVAWF